MAEKNVELIDLLKEYIAEGNLELLSLTLFHLHPADIADIFDQLDEDDLEKIFQLLDNEKAAYVLEQMDIHTQLYLFKRLSPDRVRELLDFMSYDDTADLLGELSEEEAKDFLAIMEQEEAAEVKDLLDYAEDSAGGIMTTEYVTVRMDITAEEAIRELRRIAPEAETIYYVYVVNEKEELVGVLSLRELIVAKPQALIQDIMRTNVISVDVATDQEEVARIVAKYDLLAVPVVDQEHRLVGIVTVDDIIDVIEEETTEDIYKLMGATEAFEERMPFLPGLTASVRARLPWLLITLLGGVLSGSIVRTFSDAINSIVALAYFMPLLAGMGGNVGTQSSTIVVRGLATGQISSSELLRNIMREGLIGSIIGLVVGLVVAGVAVLWQGMPILGFIVGVAMWANAMTAAIIGALVPLVFKKIGVDPAVASAPFISTTIDITGLTIYFSLVTLLISYLI